MLWSRSHIPTLREAPQDAEVVSHQLMLRAGMIRKLASGIYSFLPLGWKSLFKFESIIRQEMNRAGAQEVSLPVVQPREIWDESGRWSLYQKEMIRLKDRHENDFCLQPTSEEAIVDLARRDIRSYRQLPQNFYQIQTKFRDETRPRFGLMRGREFIMKDAYSFDLTENGAIESYERMRVAYRRIFSRAGLAFKPVDADTGAIGGTRSEEFTVLAASGEDEIVSCTQCTYGANQEKAVSRVEHPPAPKALSLEKFATAGLKTIDDLSKALHVLPRDLLKTMIATDSEGRILVVCLRGDHELHDIKLQNAFKDLKHVRLATDAELAAWKLPKGSLGPVEFPKVKGEVRYFVDDALSMDAPYVCGANEDGFHFKNAVLSRDLPGIRSGVLRRVMPNELCRQCGSLLEVVRGIEVGHVFYLGTKYSSAMNLKVSGEKGSEVVVEMGCYGIGVGRTVAASIEQNHDKDGIIWPVSLAPFELAVVSLGEGRAKAEAQKLYDEFLKAGVDVIWDDRDLSPGVKLKDVDLVGIPFQIVIGERGLKDENVEWKIRGRDKELVPLTTICRFAQTKIREAFEALEARASEAH